MPIPWNRVLTTVAAGAAAGFVTLLTLAIADLYLSGHGGNPLSRTLVDRPALGIHLSIADAIFLAVVVAGVVAGWRMTGRSDS